MNAFFVSSDTSRHSSANDTSDQQEATAAAAAPPQLPSTSSSSGVVATRPPAAAAVVAALWDNDDYDSVSDESYSWASGITDNQETTGVGRHSNGGGGGGGATASSLANWRDWRAPNNANLNNNLFYSSGLPLPLIGFPSNSANANSSSSGTSRRQPATASTRRATTTTVNKLVDICAEYVAVTLPFQLVEEFREPVPEELQLKIARASFPDHVDNIRLYSCLANGNTDEYARGEQLYHAHCVHNLMQIGFHVSAQVVTPSSTSSTSHNTSIDNHQAQQTSNVSLVCDRKRIVSCTCTCAFVAAASSSSNSHGSASGVCLSFQLMIAKN